MAKLSLGLGKNPPQAQEAPVETQESLYEKALAKMQAEPYILQSAFKKENDELAASMFEQLGGYRDAALLARECREKARLAAEKMREDAYEQALRREKNAATDTEWSELVKSFADLGDYREAPAHLAKSREGLEAARRALKRKRNRLAGVLAALAVLTAAGIRTGMFRYIYGWGFMQAGIYGQARTTFEGLGDFLDSRHRAVMSEYLAIREAGEAETVTFGDLKWKVLSKQTGRALLMLSPDKESPFYKMAYHQERQEVTWKTSSLRSYLNQEFLAAFDEEEQAYMLLQEQPASVNEDYRTAYDEVSADKITILDAAQAEKYAEASSSVKIDFWLRTPGSSYDTAAFRSGAGEVMTYGNPVDSDDIAALPVIEVDYAEAIRRG